MWHAIPPARRHATHVGGVEPGGDSVEALHRNGAREDSRTGRAIARGVVGLVGDLLDKLRAQVFHAVLKLDGLGHLQKNECNDGRSWCKPGIVLVVAAE